MKTGPRLVLKTYDVSQLMTESVALALPSGAEVIHFWIETGRVLVTVLETTADVPKLRREFRGYWLRERDVPVELRRPRYIGHVFERQYEQALVFEELDVSALPPRS